MVAPSCAGGAQVVEHDDGVKLLVAPKADGGDDALLEGGLSVLDGCVGVADTVVIWPYGTSKLDGGELRIRVPQLGTFALGEKVSIGGGAPVEPAAHDDVVIAGLTVPADCAA